jgi:hypothetical protein
MLQRAVFYLLILFSQSVSSQYQEERIKLPEELKEISGLEKVNDSLLVAMNDGGNEPRLYFINLKGVILHSTLIENVVNTDWEDLTLDTKGNLYIADVGNNLNLRRDLKILKVNLAESIRKESVSAEIIDFQYEDQKAFPPETAMLNYDCEGIYFSNDSLFLISKNRSKPWNGIATIYGLPSEKGTYVAKIVNELQLGNGGWRKDAVTAADKSDGQLYLLTYNYLIEYSETKENLVQFNKYTFNEFTQKEAVAVFSEKVIVVAAESHPLLGGPFLYLITKK